MGIEPLWHTSLGAGGRELRLADMHASQDEGWSRAPFENCGERPCVGPVKYLVADGETGVPRLRRWLRRDES